MSQDDALGTALFGAAVCAGFLLLLTPLAAPFGQMRAVGLLAVGYVAVWVLAVVLVKAVAVVLALVHVGRFVERRRIEDAHFVTKMVGACALSLGWAAFVALVLHSAGAGMPTWAAVLLYVLGLPAAYLGYGLYAPVFRATEYQLAALATAVLGYVVFAVWPAAAWALFGWCFGLILSAGPV